MGENTGGFLGLPLNIQSASKKLKTSLDEDENSSAMQVDPPLINLSNRFSSLSSDSEGPEDTTSVTSRKRKQRAKTSAVPSSSEIIVPIKVKPPPPITVRDLNINQLNTALEKFEINKNDIQIKLTQMGIKIFVKTNEQFNNLKMFLRNKKIEFFTHALKEERKTKIVLYGLPNMETDSLKAELKNQNIIPCDIKKLNLKNQRYEYQCHYLLYFKISDGVRISDLRKVQALFHIRVKWEFYTIKRTGPTQCSNCQQFGHGADNCFLTPKCIRCGEPHKSSECSLIEKENPKQRVHVSKLKCANCHQNHTANYQMCAKRIEATNALKSIKNRQTGNENRRQSASFKPAPQLDNFNFPSLTKNTQNNFSNSQYRSNETGFSNNQNDLFSPNECYQIFVEFLSQISKCNSRLEQIKVIGEMTFKYLSK